MRNARFSGLGVRWLLGAIIIGVLIGVLLGRISARALSGDLLTGLALLVIGLGAATALVFIGWLLGRASAGQKPSTLFTPTISDTVEPQPTSPQSVQTGSVPAVGFEPETTVSPVAPSALPLSSPGPLPAAPVEPKAAGARVLALGSHLALRADGGRLAVRLSRLFGYETLQVAVGFDTGWFARLSSSTGRQQMASEGRVWLKRGDSLPWLLFVGALLVYAITRLVSLDQFPINFFADEAVQVTNAIDLVHRGFRDPQGGLFPVYFNVFFFINPDIAVYLHAITASLFGESIVVARATSAILTLIAAGAVGLMLKQVFNARYWWSAVLLLAVTPVWFQHSRTAFDAAGMAAFYALFIVFYLLYRYRSPRYLYLAVVFAGLTFYAYPSGQVAIGALALFLLLVDIRYHLQHLRTLLWALPLAIVLVIPFVRFQQLHPDAVAYHLSQDNSYWLQNVPLSDKLAQFADTYFRVISPGYWFLPNTLDLIRHRMEGYSFLPLVELPLLLLGLALCVRYFKESKYRTLLVALIVAPIGGALVDVGILRTLAFVIPVSIISAIGLEWILTRIKRPRTALVISLVVFALLSVMGIAMLQDALTNGPTWFSDYTLYGMQWGSKQIYVDKLPQVLDDNPDATVFISDSWANGSDIFPRFFSVDPARVQVKTVLAWLQKKTPLPANAIFVMTPDEYNQASTSPKFQNVDVLDTIPYPNGKDGFYIAHVEYADNADAVFAQELEVQRQLLTESVTIDGQKATVAHTKFDIGNLQAIFDGDLKTVARGVEANPLVLDIQFATPRQIQKLSAYFGKANVHLLARAYSADGGDPTVYEQDYNYINITTEIPAGQVAELALDKGPAKISRLRVEITYTNSDETAHVHVFDMKFQ
ncbi:MAG: glycosyltransferase family 39 protein [Anaerolineae bacterium]